MPAQYQQGCRGLFLVMGKARVARENHCMFVRNRQNSEDITKHKCRDICLPGISSAKDKKVDNQ